MEDVKLALTMVVDYAFIVPIIVGIVQVIKKWTPEALDDKLLPTISVVLGIGFGLVIQLSMTGAMAGIILGLTSTGLYGAVKEQLQNFGAKE